MQINKFGIVEKQFEYKGHDCICVFTHWGVRNGYVSVNENKECRDYLNIDCHGGITFAGELPYDYGQKAKYYIGFDCGHANDARDFWTAWEYGLIDMEMRDYREETMPHFGLYVASLGHVESECKWIVRQLEGKKE